MLRSFFITIFLRNSVLSSHSHTLTRWQLTCFFYVSFHPYKPFFCFSITITILHESWIIVQESSIFNTFSQALVCLASLNALMVYSWHLNFSCKQNGIKWAGSSTKQQNFEIWVIYEVQLHYQHSLQWKFNHTELNVGYVLIYNKLFIC